MYKQTSESHLYAALGASSSKDGVHKALGGLTSGGFFAEVRDDVAGDPSYYSLLHADGAGTKAIVAYLAFRETGSTSWFKSLAIDSLVMNLDDVACVGSFESLLLSNTIGRNRTLVPDEAVGEIIAGYKEFAERLSSLGIGVSLAGGETADMGDVIRTIVIDSTMFGRVKRSSAINTHSIQDGDTIVGLSNSGQASYEDSANSSIGSNGFTLARHALIEKSYAEKYPEILDPAIAAQQAYRGKQKLFDSPSPLKETIASALLSPTRTYAPVIKSALKELQSEVHGIIHCSGGGQSKALRFGNKKRFVKDNFFPIPPVFELIQNNLDVPWREMYTVFNMGHRMEVIVPKDRAKAVVDVASSFGIEGKIVGYIEDAVANSVVLKTPHGTFEY